MYKNRKIWNSQENIEWKYYNILKMTTKLQVTKGRLHSLKMYWMYWGDTWKLKKKHDNEI